MGRFCGPRSRWLRRLAAASNSVSPWPDVTHSAICIQSALYGPMHLWGGGRIYE